MYVSINPVANFRLFGEKYNVNFPIDNMDDLKSFNEKLKEDGQHKTDFSSHYFDSDFLETCFDYFLHETSGKITVKVRMETLYNSMYSKFWFHIHLKDIVGDFTGNILFQIIFRKESKKTKFNLLKKPLAARLEFSSVGLKIGMVIEKIATLSNVYNHQETMIRGMDKCNLTYCSTVFMLRN